MASYKLVAPGGYERPREMYEALNATLTSVRGSFLLVVLQLLGYAAFHAHVFCAPLQVLFWVAFLLHIALLLILYFELGLAARGMKTRGALLFYATRLYAKLRRKLQPQKQRRQKAALLVLAGIAVAEIILLSFRACCGDGSCALTYVCMGPTAAPPPPDALPGAAHVWLVAIDVAALLLKLMMPLQLLRLHRHRAAVADFLHNNPLARGADGRADGAATPRHNRRQPTLPDELSKLLRRARPDRIADLEGSFLRVAKGANVEVVDAQSGRRAPRFLRVDDEFQQLRWSWNIDHVLLIDEIAEVEWHGGARCTVHYHATHSSLEHQTLAWTLAFAKQHEAATWVSVLRLLMRVDAARHGLDLQQRTRLKTAFKRAAKASNTLTVNQQYQFFEHLNLDLRQAHAGAQLSRVQLDRARALVRTEGKARERTILKSPEQMLANMRSPEGVINLGRETRGDGGAGGSDKAGSDKAPGRRMRCNCPSARTGSSCSSCTPC